MEQGKFSEIQEGNARPNFFFDQWQRAQSAAAREPAASPARGWKALAQTWTQREPNEAAIPADAPATLNSAQASLGKFKDCLEEYKAAQQSYRQLQLKALGDLSPRDKAQVAQALRRVEALLDRLERELRGGRQRTKAVMDELRAAS